ncbi:hypothetical protein GCM10022223_05680 [Kineosporia mesophila]|uniref:Uncharacterized protein n=1 Tax=Kineosporia mesophila TaxID=566012 RepID=A0ABP6Z395_9ACTN|nr:hypothetical protein [Kineosporia mesophila]MCD5350953.1 hypothetical protein [Kineosporia mesophila]
MTITSGSTYVSYGQFHLKGSEYFDTEGWVPGQGNGLIEALEEPGVPAVPGDFAILLTGGTSSKIALTVDIRDHAPDHQDLDEWEDVAEVSLNVEDDDIFGIGTLEEARGDDIFPTLPEGQYRVRAHARGRHEARTSPKDNEIQEEFLLLVWPASPEPEAVLKAIR